MVMVPSSAGRWRRLEEALVNGLHDHLHQAVGNKVIDIANGHASLINSDNSVANPGWLDYCNCLWLA